MDATMKPQQQTEENGEEEKKPKKGRWHKKTRQGEPEPKY